MSAHEHQASVSLDPGMVVLEASAGTGKTHQITNLVARLVAVRGICMREIVVVSFTKAATAELRDRIRRRLSETLDAIEAGHHDMADLQAIVTECQENRAVAIQRLKEAQRDFDQALISTIHGFCQRMIDSHGFECGADPGRRLLQDTSEILEEIVDDWLTERLRGADLQRYRSLVRDAGFHREGLLKLARTATADPEMPMEPAEDRWTPEGFAGEAAALADRWSGPEGQAVVLAVDQAQIHAEETLRGLVQSAGEPLGDPVSKGDWLAEIFINKLQWWPPIGDPLKSGLHSTSTTNLGRWADGMEGTSPEGQAAALSLSTLRFEAGKHIQALETWLRAVQSPDEPTESKAIEALLGVATADFPDDARSLLVQTAVFMDYRKCLATMERVRFARWCRSELKRRCEARRLRTFHDQLQLLGAPLADPSSPLARRLTDSIGSRVRATLIDEFQDTDALQWQIFQTLLGPWRGPGSDPRSHSEHRLFLIGDPKQAIYSFRGANIHVYLDARSAAQEGAGRVHTLGTNYRTDLGLLQGLAHMMGDRPGYFGDERISFDKVDAHHNSPRLQPAASPLQIRFLQRDPAETAKPLTRQEADAEIPRQVAADVVKLLKEKAGYKAENEPVDPGDIAVLVRNHVDGRMVHAELRACGVPSINFSKQDVFKSETCTHLLAWLRAIQEPGRASITRTAATSPLIGMDGAVLAGIDADLPESLRAWENWVEALRGWRDEFPKRRFLATLRSAMDSRQIQRRLLSRTDGERRVSDLMQLSELVHAAETEGRLGLSALITWLEQQRRDKAEDPDAVDIRLESEHGAVKILTMHTSKGLEYPVVFVPYAWRSARLSGDAKNNLVISDSSRPTHRTLDLQLCHAHPEKAAHLAQTSRDQLEEAIRLNYVALTRAEYRCILYTGHIQPLSGSPLASMLHGDGGEPGEDRLTHAAQQVGRWTRAGARDAERDAMWAALEDWAKQAPTIGSTGVPAVSVEQCTPVGAPPQWEGVPADKATLRARRWVRTGLDRSWGRHSYSRFVKSASGGPPHPVTALEDHGLDLDQDVLDPAEVQRDEQGEPVPLSSFPAGATPGIVLHEVLEKIDFQWARDAQKTDPQLPQMVESILLNSGMSEHTETLSDGLSTTLRTPLGGPLGSLCLADLRREDRLDELRFDLPLAGGDKHDARACGPVRGADLVRALSAAPSEGVPQDYLSLLQQRDWIDMSGFLNGAIDLVMRAPCADGTQQWFVVDYKSNRLAPSSQAEVPVQTYRPARLLEEMSHHDYHLQYHLYTLALHRFLKHRLQDYDYERDFGGALYLFVRGMVGDAAQADLDKPQNGIVYARPAQEVIHAMDSLIRGTA